MLSHSKFYIGGQWISATDPALLDVLNPATEEIVARVALGGAKDLEVAIRAAREALAISSRSTKSSRIAGLQRIIGVYERRMADLAEAVHISMGAPRWLARGAQVTSGLENLRASLAALIAFEFESQSDQTYTVYEAAGVCGLITPWNWPINQITSKFSSAYAAGCSVILKPSEVAPLDALIFAEIIDEAELTPGVFNLINGFGPIIGKMMSSHPGIDVISFTGSTRAGVDVARSAASTVKRSCLELGGKSANIILASCDMDRAVRSGVRYCFHNTGQSCSAPTRMLVPKEHHDRLVSVAQQACAATIIGGPDAPSPALGPLVSHTQYLRVQQYISLGIEEGAQLACGGIGKPAGYEQGYYVKPTVFANVNNHMRIAQEEIFGPVLCIIPYESEEEAIRIANDSCYGLSGYVSGAFEDAKRVALRLRTGNVHINGAGIDSAAPFGGYKESGLGREHGVHGLYEFLETKAIMTSL